MVIKKKDMITITITKLSIVVRHYENQCEMSSCRLKILASSHTYPYRPFTQHVKPPSPHIML